MGWGKGIATFVIGSIILTAIVWGAITYGPDILERIRGTTNISDITNNPGRYMGKQVEVKGMVSAIIQPRVGILIDPETGGFIFLTNLPEDFTPIAARYRVKGIVTTYTQPGLGTSLAIDVVEIKLA